MAQLISKVIFKYILFLIFCFASSIALVLSVHIVFNTLSLRLEEKSTNLHAKIDISRHIQKDITELHIALLELSAATTTKATRELKLNEIRTKIAQSQKDITILSQGGIFRKTFSQNGTDSSIAITYLHPLKGEDKPLEITLSSMGTLIDTLTQLLTLRETYIEQNNPQILPVVSQLRAFNANLSQTFGSIEAKLQESINHDYVLLEKLEIQNKTQNQWYTLAEVGIILLSVFIIVFIIYKILQQILYLYKELETQLYVDTLTKLKSRSALLRDIKEAKHPCVIVIDITMFRTINELYGVEVGNEVLQGFASSLKIFAKNRDFNVYRISGDEFVFFKDDANIHIEHYTHLMDTFFDSMSHKSIYVSSLEDTIYLEMSAGISFDKLNPLGTADIALNRAKALHKNYIVYHGKLDAISEIKQGVLWKKKIIHGFESNLFVPFFQPIVNREEKIVKYEALMRLIPSDGGAHYISPHAFLDVAIKTHYYDQISQMTLMKSLHVSAQKGVNVSLNLNFQDILNKPLLALMKHFITKEHIGHRVVFEIVESQKIQDYALLKQFMEEFRNIGVRFAIDDFGTGFSNFTHILELSPDFVKIDGSLIKHLDSDKKSYELVKAIVFFSKELGIQTVAEFVHSKEVFEVALSLGIDQFQGYYFGMPHKEI